MAIRRPTRQELPEPPTLHDRALADLRFIRQTMEGASAFTTFSGWGLAAVGALAVPGGWLAARQPTREGWLLVWLALAAVAVVVAGVSTWWKARRTEQSPLGGPGQRFALSLAPPLAAGALLSLILVRMAAWDLLPGVWLLLYGAGLVTGGAFSARVVPATGVGFMALGALALLGPAAWGDSLLVGGFGVLHLALGLTIGARHGG